MTTTIQSFVPADYTVWALGGLVFVTAVADALYLCTLPCCRQAGSDRPTRPSSAGGDGSKKQSLPILFYTRALMFVALAFWGASLILPLNVIWGPNSVVASANVTNWTSQGWLCRIFITLALGVTCPLVCVLGLCILVAMLYRVQESQETLVSQQPVCCVSPRKSHIFERSVILSILVTLPIAAAQSVVSWISLTISYDGGSIEESPKSLIGTFLALYWYGNSDQCDVNVFTGVVTTNEYACTMCVFPAASVIIHGVWVILLVLGLIYVTHALCRLEILRQSVKRRIKAYCTCMSLACIAGLCCMGVSIAYHDPFSWTNQGLWLGYVATVLVSCVSVTYMLDDVPKIVAQDIHAQTVPMGFMPPPPPAPLYSVPSSRMMTAPVFNPMDQIVEHSYNEDDGDDASEAYFSTRESPSKRSMQSDSFFSLLDGLSSTSPSSRPHRDRAEDICDVLLHMQGATSASIIEYRPDHADEQKIYKTGTQAEYWKMCSIQACFPVQDLPWAEEEASVREHVMQCLEDMGVQTDTMTVLPIRPEDWESNIRGEYQPMMIDESLWVIPSWSEIQDQSAINVILHPGLSFGTGSHPTTRMCLAWLHSIKDRLVSGASVMDYGMGSGVLAIAALVMGAGHAVGTDIESLSLKAASYNASLNNVEDRLEVYQVSEDGDPCSEHGTHDVIVANILRGPLIELAPTIASYRRDATLLGLSGITLGQSEDVKAAYAPWFENFEVHHDDDGGQNNAWVLITATSKPM